MAKKRKTRKTKILSSKRRQKIAKRQSFPVEVVDGGIKKEIVIEKEKPKENIYWYPVEMVRKDLMKTIILSVVIFVGLFGYWWFWGR